MKKLILMLCVCFSVAIVSCKETDKKMDADANSEMHEEHAADQADMAMNAEYQCPMDCEEGKTYDSPGTCPVCAMDLKKVEKEGEHTHNDGETHQDHEDDHDSNEDHN
ncbi:MAG: hypothetical protein DA407_06670 [Bacteroidetes bacterium]|nr:MAG: hypothetical protein DA407_06670 [Bacteroidota bacterium]